MMRMSNREDELANVCLRAYHEGYQQEQFDKHTTRMGHKEAEKMKADGKVFKKTVNNRRGPSPSFAQRYAEIFKTGGVTINLDNHEKLYDPCEFKNLVITNGVVKGSETIVSINHVISIEDIKKYEQKEN